MDEHGTASAAAREVDAVDGFRGAFLVNLASVAGGTVFSFGVSLVLARLLVPAEMGEVAIALAVMGVAQVLRDFGVGTWLQRAPTLGQAEFSRALGLVVTTTALLAVALFAAGAPLARHFGLPALRPLLDVLLVGFVLSPFSAVMAALMQRELAAGRIACVSRMGGAAHAVTALGLAAAGGGAMSLAWAYVVNIVVCSLAYLPLRPPGLAWRPSRHGWRPLLRFGAGSLAVSGLAGVNDALPVLLLGRLGSAQQVGLLGRANAVANVFHALLGSAVNFGALRRLADLHHRQVALAPRLLRDTALLTGAAWPVLALVALFPRELVLLLYGPAWIDAAPAVPALAATTAVGLLFHYGGAALAAVGRPQVAVVPVAVTLGARLALAAAFFDGRLVTFAAVLLGAAVVALPVQAWLLVRCLGLRWRTLAASALRSAAPCAAAVGVAALLREAGPADGVFVGVAVAGAALAWLTALRLVRHPWWDELRQPLPWPPRAPASVGPLSRLRSTIRK
jgi:O-antigen/teichoic acid export membrane protein